MKKEFIYILLFYVNMCFSQENELVKDNLSIFNTTQTESLKFLSNQLNEDFQLEILFITTDNENYSNKITFNQVVFEVNSNKTLKILVGSKVSNYIKENEVREIENQYSNGNDNDNFQDLLKSIFLFTEKLKSNGITLFDESKQRNINNQNQIILENISKSIKDKTKSIEYETNNILSFLEKTYTKECLKNYITNAEVKAKKIEKRIEENPMDFLNNEDCVFLEIYELTRNMFLEISNSKEQCLQKQQEKFKSLIDKLNLEFDAIYSLISVYNHAVNKTNADKYPFESEIKEDEMICDKKLVNKFNVADLNQYKETTDILLTKLMIDDTELLSRQLSTLISLRFEIEEYFEKINYDGLDLYYSQLDKALEVLYKDKKELNLNFSFCNSLKNEMPHFVVFDEMIKNTQPFFDKINNNQILIYIKDKLKRNKELLKEYINLYNSKNKNKLECKF